MYTKSVTRFLTSLLVFAFVNLTSCSQKPSALFQRTTPARYSSASANTSRPAVPLPVLEASARAIDIPAVEASSVTTFPASQTVSPTQRNRQLTRPKQSATNLTGERFEAAALEKQQAITTTFYEPAKVLPRSDKVVLPVGAQVTAQLIQPVNSAYVQPGQLIPVRIINDVTVKKVKLIKGGAAGMATVLAVDRGKKPFVSIALTSVQAIDGQQIPVTSGQIRTEGSQGGVSVGGLIGFTLLFTFGLLALIGGAAGGGLFMALGAPFLLIKKPSIPAEINVGTTLSGVTASEVEIEID